MSAPVDVTVGGFDDAERIARQVVEEMKAAGVPGSRDVVLPLTFAGRPWPVAITITYDAVNDDPIGGGG